MIDRRLRLAMREVDFDREVGDDEVEQDDDNSRADEGRSLDSVGIDAHHQQSSTLPDQPGVGTPLRTMGDGGPDSDDDDVGGVGGCDVGSLQVQQKEVVVSGQLVSVIPGGPV